MKRSEKVIKPRVSWAQGSKLCQVKLFRKMECPYKVGPRIQPQNFSNHSSGGSGEPNLAPGFQNYHALKPNVSNIPHINWKQPPQVKLTQKEHRPSQVRPQPQPHSFSKHSSEEPLLPPGFENYCPVLKPNVSIIPQIKWKRPQLKFSFDAAWQIKDGDESTERDTQDLRNSKILEAFYPYPSSIPPRPAVSMEVENERFDDSKTPIIPLTPIEDKLESKDDSSHNTATLQEVVSELASSLSLLDKEQRSMIDTTLLVKVLTEPEMVMKNQLTAGTTSDNDQPAVTAASTMAQREQQPLVISQLPFTNQEQRRASPPMAQKKQQPLVISQPFTNQEQRRASPPVAQRKQHPLVISQPLTNQEKRRGSPPVAQRKQEPLVISQPPFTNQEQRKASPPMAQRIQQPLVISQLPFTNQEQRKASPPMAQRKQQPLVISQLPFTNQEQRRASPPMAQRKQQPLVISQQPFTNQEQMRASPPMAQRKQQPLVISQLPFTNQEQRRASPPMAQRKQQPLVISQLPFTNQEQRRASPPMPGNGNISSLRPVTGQPVPVWLPLSSCVGVAKEQSLSPWLPSSSCVGIAKEHSLSAWLPSSSLPVSHNFQRLHKVVQPMTSKEHVKILIREHGKETHEKNQNQSIVVNRRINDKKIRKQCIYFGTARGCRNGDGCGFLHDSFRSNAEGEALKTKRMKYGN